jgi:hypothetical protein
VANTIEIVEFELQDGVERDRFIEQNKQVERDFVAQQPGFVDRETGFNEEGKVVVVLHWESPDAAQGSMDKFESAPETQDFTKLIDMSTFKMTRYEHV